MDSYSFLSSYFYQCNPDQFIELTYIHHDKTLPGHIVTQFVRVGDKQGLRNHLEAAQRYNERGFGVYYGVCPRATLPDAGRRGSESHVDTIVGFWTELDSVKEGREVADDLNKLQSLAMPPSLCVLSGGGVQGYWLLTEPVRLTDDNRALIKSALRGLGKSVGGDLQVAEYARVLRVPGFVNTKPERGGARTELVLPAEKHRYQLEQLIVYAPPPEPERKSRPPIEHIAPHGEKVDTARAALDAVSPSRRDNYEDWYQVGMTLQELGSDGLYLWDAWSAGSDKYKPGECQRKWDSFRGSGLTLASLYHMADQDSGTGWRPVKIDLTPTLPASKSETTVSPLNWSKGLNIGERGALNRYAPPGIAAVIDLWAGSGNAAEAVDAEFLLCLSDEANRGLTVRQIRSALNRLPVVFLTIRAGIKDSTREESITNPLVDSYCLRELSERKIGRPSQLYALADRASVREYILKVAVPKIIKECFPKKDNALPLAPPIHAAFLEELGLDADEAAARAKELEARYGAELRSQPGWRSAMQDVRRKVNALKEQLQDARYVALPDGAPLEKRPNVLAAAARALIALLGGAFQMAQDKVCALIGCRKNELASVCRNAGIVVDHHVYAVRSVLTHPALLAIPIKFDPSIGGFPIDVKSTHDDRPMGIRSPRLAAWALKQLRSMATLTVRYQMTNCYKLAEPSVAVVETVEPTIKQDLKVDPKPVQPPLAGLDAPRDTFRPWLRARLRFGLIAHVLNALVMAWQVARDVERYARQHADRIVKYGEAVVNKLVDLAKPWQRVGDLVVDPATGETKPKGVQLSFDLLLESEATWKDSPLTSSGLPTGPSSLAPPLVVTDTSAILSLCSP